MTAVTERVTRLESREEPQTWQLGRWIHADARSVTAASRAWIGGDGTWVDGAGNNANWSGLDEPDTDDEAIFSSNNVINLGSANSVLALTMSASVEMNLDKNILAVAGIDRG